jgi:hypothetical protein
MNELLIVNCEQGDEPAERATLTRRLLAWSGNDYSGSQLAALPLDHLRALARAAPPPMFLEGREPKSLEAPVDNAASPDSGVGLLPPPNLMQQLLEGQRR